MHGNNPKILHRNFLSSFEVSHSLFSRISWYVHPESSTKHFWHPSVVENSSPVPVPEPCSSSTWVPCSGAELLLEGSRKFLLLGRVKPLPAPPEIQGESIIFLPQKKPRESRVHVPTGGSGWTNGLRFHHSFIKHLQQCQAIPHHRLRRITRQISILKKMLLPRKGQQK